jgi:putative transposase
MQAERQLVHEYHAPTGTQVGTDLGLTVNLTTSAGVTVANPRVLSKAEKRRKRFHRRVSRK